MLVEDKEDQENAIVVMEFEISGVAEDKDRGDHITQPDYTHDVVADIINAELYISARVIETKEKDNNTIVKVGLPDTEQYTMLAYLKGGIEEVYQIENAQIGATVKDL